ncbi:hypothetical protein EB796_013609 [Bugula neritina]|uniref:Uncharacterized protein n=1 Tax=Bugula neritina TaxID=10212 RepID=A0A7J7JRN7_BUGNE|nr:hypothetical protein EB796_013609 [Bugula neritina]
MTSSLEWVERYSNIVQFLIGGLVYLCNGRPALKLNRDYTQLEEISTSGSSQSSASNSVTEKQGSGSDNELRQVLHKSYMYKNLSKHCIITES